MTHLRFIKLNDHFVPFKSKDLSYLLKVSGITLINPYGKRDYLTPFLSFRITTIQSS